MAKDKHAELAGRLRAATVSYQMGFKSIYRVLRDYSDVEIGVYWHDLAEEVVESIITGGMPRSGISKLIH
jgi:hypothetical protein